MSVYTLYVVLAGDNFIKRLSQESVIHFSLQHNFALKYPYRNLSLLYLSLGSWSQIITIYKLFQHVCTNYCNTFKSKKVLKIQFIHNFYQSYYIWREVEKLKQKIYSLKGIFLATLFALFLIFNLRFHYHLPKLFFVYSMCPFAHV